MQDEKKSVGWSWCRSIREDQPLSDSPEKIQRKSLSLREGRKSKASWIQKGENHHTKGSDPSNAFASNPMQNGYIIYIYSFEIL